MRTLIAILTLSVLSTTTWADVDSLRAEANVAAAAGEIEVAAGKLRQILDLSPTDGATHYQIGSLLMDNGGDLHDAAHHFERARDLEFQPLGAAYRLSRLYAREGRSDDALEQMEVMAEGGFGFLNLIEGQADYDSIKNSPRFSAALDAIRSAKYPCKGDDRHRAFDFWIGEWTVTQNGQFAGNSKIEAILGHCTIFEQWEGASGTVGKSFNYYDPGHDHWRQIWISDNGTFIEFTGEARDGGIFYTAQTINPADGSVTHHKFEFTVIGEDGVRQYWETSTDGGETWQTIWDGHYAPSHDQNGQ
jgi:hypothetical protein